MATCTTGQVHLLVYYIANVQKIIITVHAWFQTFFCSYSVMFIDTLGPPETVTLGIEVYFHNFESVLLFIAFLSEAQSFHYGCHLSQNANFETFTKI